MKCYYLRTFLIIYSGITLNFLSAGRDTDDKFPEQLSVQKVSPTVSGRHSPLARQSSQKTQLNMLLKDAICAHMDNDQQALSAIADFLEKYYPEIPVPLPNEVKITLQALKMLCSKETE